MSSLGVYFKNWFFILFSLFTTFVLLNSKIFPFTGFAIFFSVLAIIFLYFKQVRKIETYFWFSVSLILSSFLVLYANPILAFFNVSLILYSLSNIITSSYKISFLQAIISPVLNVVSITTTPLDISYRLLPILRFSSKPKPWGKIFLTFFSSFLILIIFVGILSTANPIFNNFFNSIFNFLIAVNFFRIISWIFETLFNFQFWSAIIMAVILKKTSVYLAQQESTTEQTNNLYSQYQNRLTNINKKIALIWPKITASFVILIFFLTQIQLYLGNQDLLKSLGITAQQKVQEIFLQLLIITLITIFLLFIDISKQKRYRFVSYFLIFEAIFLLLNALKSDIDYVTLFGFGPQRLYGFAVIIFTTVALIFSYKNIRNRNDSLFFKQILGTICLVFIAINIINFDSSIVTLNNQSNKDTEVGYLSTDSQS